MSFYTVFERGWLSSNNIVFATGERTAIVDTGYTTHAPQTCALLHTALQGRSLDLIANTHLHSDHCGGNALLQDTYPAVHTLIPPGQAAAVTTWDEDTLSYRPTGQLCPRFRHDGQLQPGTHIALGSRSWQIHAAPGHDPSSVILFEPQSRTLISADALWENGLGVIFPELEGVQAFDEASRTLDVIEQLSPTTIIPGHGRVFHELAPALTRARNRLEKFSAQPTRHTQYAAKALLKYKLLELQQASLPALRAWFEHMPYSAVMQQRFFTQLTLSDWFDELLADLQRSGAARLEGGRVYNQDT